MRIVLDINVLLVSLPVGKKYRPIFDALKAGAFTLLITNEILTEYEEKIGEKTKPEIAENVVRLLLNLPNVERVRASTTVGISSPTTRTTTNTPIVRWQPMPPMSYPTIPIFAF